jgi:hypothetical protein
MKRRLFEKRKLYLPVIAFFGIIMAGAAAERTVFSELSNRELKQKASVLAKDVRGLIASHNKKEEELMAEYDRRDRPGSNVVSARSLRDQWLSESDAIHETTMRYYKEHYWADAILLTDELLRRQPKRAQQRDILKIYQYPTNVLGLRAIADHLEATAKSLPDR